MNALVITASESEIEKEQATVGYKIEQSFLEELTRLEKDASIKGVIKGTMLAAGATAGLTAGAAALPYGALALSPSVRKSEKKIKKLEHRRRGSQMEGRNEQAWKQIPRFRTKRVKSLSKYYLTGDPSHKREAEGHLKKMKSLRGEIKTRNRIVSMMRDVRARPKIPGK